MTTQVASITQGMPGEVIEHLKRHHVITLSTSSFTGMPHADTVVYVNDASGQGRPPRPGFAGRVSTILDRLTFKPGLIVRPVGFPPKEHPECAGRRRHCKRTARLKTRGGAAV